MPKLHELLAVQGNLSGQSTKLRTDLSVLFKSKKHHFTETTKIFISSEEGTAKEPVLEDQQNIQTTVLKEITWICPHLAKSLDVAFQVDMANTKAAADVIPEEGEEPLLRNIPATTLLQLEKRVVEWKAMIADIPTLDPAKGFEVDPNHREAKQGKGIYKAREVKKPRTRKVKEIITLSPATDKFAANVQVYDADKTIGQTQETEWSSMITPALKADLLDRVETLFRAVTKARAKANEYSLESKEKIGSTLLEYVFQPLLGA
jgi:flagellar basal body rod protein FlgC